MVCWEVDFKVDFIVGEVIIAVDLMVEEGLVWGCVRACDIEVRTVVELDIAVCLFVELVGIDELLVKDEDVLDVVEPSVDFDDEDILKAAYDVDGKVVGLDACVEDSVVTVI